MEKRDRRRDRKRKGVRKGVRVREGCATADMAHENFYDFYALASAHLEIRFNSLNFKKLPPLSLAPSADRGP